MFSSIVSHLFTVLSEHCKSCVRELYEIGLPTRSFSNWIRVSKCFPLEYVIKYSQRYLPSQATCYLNGHNYMEQELLYARIRYCKNKSNRKEILKFLKISEGILKNCKFLLLFATKQ